MIDMDNLSANTTPPPLLSACLIVKNEAHCLAQCLDSLLGLVDELIVVDTGSTDDTISIAQHYNAKIFTYPWNDHFAEARNFALKQATGQFILSIDADETLDPASANKIHRYLQDSRLRNQSFVLNFKVCSNDQRPMYKRALFPNLPQIRWAGRVHEILISDEGFLPAYNDAEMILWHLSEPVQANKQAKYHSLLKQALAEETDPLLINHLQKHLGLSHLERKEWRLAWNLLQDCYLGIPALGILPTDGFYGDVLKGLTQAGLRLGLPEVQQYTQELYHYAPQELQNQLALYQASARHSWQKSLLTLSLGVLAACQPASSIAPTGPVTPSTQQSLAQVPNLLKPAQPNDLRIQDTDDECPDNRYLSSCYAATPYGFWPQYTTRRRSDGEYCVIYTKCCRIVNDVEECLGADQPININPPEETGMEVCSDEIRSGNARRNCFSCPPGQAIVFKDGQPVSCEAYEQSDSEKHYFSVQNAEKPFYQRYDTSYCRTEDQ